MGKSIAPIRHVIPRDVIKVHQGVMYRRCKIFYAVDDDDFGDILIVTGANKLHLSISIAAGGDSEGYLYEDVTVSDNGTEMDVLCFNRVQPCESSTVVYHTPVVTDVGDFLCAEVAFGGTGGNALGGNAKFDIEWVLKPSSNYLIRHINRAGLAKTLFTVFEWYED